MVEHRAASKLGTALKLFVFSFLALFGLPVFSWLLIPFQAFIQATLHVFAASAVANAITVRIYERGKLADIGMQWNRMSATNLGIGMGCGVGQRQSQKSDNKNDMIQLHCDSDHCPEVSVAFFNNMRPAAAPTRTRCSRNGIPCPQRAARFFHTATS